MFFIGMSMWFRCWTERIRWTTHAPTGCQTLHGTTSQSSINRPTSMVSSRPLSSTHETGISGSPQQNQKAAHYQVSTCEGCDKHCTCSSSSTGNGNEVFNIATEYIFSLHLLEHFQWTESSTEKKIMLSGRSQCAESGRSSFSPSILRSSMA